VAAIVSSLVLAVPFAFGATSITPANGQEYLVPTGNVYQRDSSGVYHLIPDLPTATKMGVLWSQVKHVQSIGPIGSPLQSVLTLPTYQVTTTKPTTMANGQDFLLPGGSIYQRDAKGVYHLIPNILTATAMHVDGSRLTRVSKVSPLGAPLPSVVISVKRVCTVQAKTAQMPANGADYIVPNGNVYQLANGSYHLIPDLATANEMGVQWNKLHRVLTQSISPVGTPIPSVCSS
jgi:hypothetical protein